VIYRTPEAFRAALEDRLVRRSRQSGLPLDRLRKYAAFERFLARVEMTGPRSWVLKGGLAINCRLGSYLRPSKDIDLAHGDGPVELFERLVAGVSPAMHPDDHFRFRLSLDAGGRRTPDASVRLRLETRLADRLYDLATIDVVTEPDLFEGAELLELPSMLDFADLVPVTMLVTPVERHLADKLDAYLRGRINARAISTREKDLADMVLLAASERPRAGVLRRALRKVLTAERRVPAALPPPPPRWGAAYRALATQLGLEERTVMEAFERARALFDPVLSGAAPEAACWNPEARVWEFPGHTG
jgi:Nucleotidyl transferase AbiEii toxin, Type IV TA system